MHRLLRLWRSRKGLAIVASAILGVGSASALATYRSLDTQFLAPARLLDEQDVVSVYASRPGRRGESRLAATWNRGTFRSSLVAELRALPAFAEIGVWQTWAATVLEGPSPEYVNGLEASASTVRLVGGSVIAGRYFEEGDGPSVLIGHGLWLRRFGGAPDVVGRSVSIGRGLPGSAESRLVTGVLRPGFRFRGTEVDVVISPGHALSTYVIGKLNDGFALDDAAAQAARVAATMPGDDFSAEVIRYSADVMRGQDQLAWVTFAAALLLLAVACSSTANLLVADVERRRTDLRIRRELGASSWRIARTEARALATLIPVVALVTFTLSMIADAILTQLQPAFFSSVSTSVPTWITGLRAVGLGIISVLLAGVFAVALSVFHDQADGTVRRRLQQGFASVAVMIAVSAVVLATILADSIRQLSSRQAGGHPDGLYVVSSTYWRADQALANSDVRDMVESLSALPGVQSAAAGTASPLGGLPNKMTIGVSGEAPLERPVAYQVVTPDYFETVGLTIASGRPFVDSDRADSDVAIVSREFERQFLPDGAVGRNVSWRSGDVARVVGVVDDVRFRSVRDDVEPAVYFLDWTGRSPGVHFVVRTSDSIPPSPQEIEQVVRRNRLWAIRSVQPVTALLAAETAQDRLRASLASSFGLLSLGLAVAGVFGSVTFQLAMKRSELAIRVALGAGPGRIALGVFAEGASLTLIGGLVALPVAFVASGTLRGLVFGVPPPATLVFVVAFSSCAIATLLALAVPAWRAGRIDPKQWLSVQKYY